MLMRCILQHALSSLRARMLMSRMRVTLHVQIYTVPWYCTCIYIAVHTAYII